MERLKYIVFLVLLIAPAFALADNLTPEQKAALERELAQVEAEQKQAESDLSVAKNKSASLSNDIAVLNAKIKAAQLNIKAKNLLIQTLGNDITQKQNHIDDLEDHIDKSKESLSDILRRTNELGDYSPVMALLSEKTVTSFFQDVDTFSSVHESLQVTINGLRTDQASTEAEKEALDNRRSAELDAKHVIEVEQKNIQSDEKQKQTLLAVSKNNEKSYSTLIADKRAKAAEIRAKLFALRDAAPIPFGQALQYATLASQKTGVRPAFLLAILTQESSLGKNVGQCYVTNFENGDGINARTGKAVEGVMSPKRDVPPFREILSELGGDPTRQVVSCPLDIGWGGAMGPAQFIPSTWMLFKDRVAKEVGISGMPDPWNPMHAFMASATYLADLGASAQTYSSERNAACKYYSGKSCGLVRGNTTYGNSVVAQADTIQRTMIDPLQGI